MQVQVFHDNTQVAVVNFGGEDIEYALEYAWRNTNNIEGSWSMGPMIRSLSDHGAMEENSDYNVNVRVMVDLPSDDHGRICGLRSSMVGDIFRVEGKNYRVTSFGFDPCEF